MEKAEVLAFFGPRGALTPGTSIVVGIVLDGRWKFDGHFRRLAPRLLAAAGAFERLLPNLGRPSDKCRRLYIVVVTSMALHGAPIWAEALRGRNVPSSDICAECWGRSRRRDVTIATSLP